MFFSHHPDERRIIKTGVTNALLAAAYVAGVVALMSIMQRVSGDRPDSKLAPFAFLMLFVVSAATTGGLVFGKPLMWYLDGKKSEAVRLAVWTIGTLAALTTLLFCYLAVANV